MSIGFAAPEHTTSSGAAPSVVSSDGEAARSSAASSFVVVGRLLLLLVAAAALVSGIVLARAHDRAISGSVARYVCPMHPEVASSTPGDCPICGMALDPVTESARVASLSPGTDDTGGTAHAERRIFAEQVRAAASLGPDGVGTAVLYRDDLVGLNPGEHALFFGGAAPSMGIDVRLVDEPPSPVDASTVTVRFRLDPTSAPPSFRGPRDVGSLQIALRPRELLVVPSSAVLYSAEGPYVLAVSEHDETFTKRSVEIGRILDSGYVGGRAGEVGSIVILSGLNEGDAGDRGPYVLRGRREASPGGPRNGSENGARNGRKGDAMMARLVDWCTRHSAMVLAVALALGIAGELSRRALSRDAVPDLSDPQIGLVADWMGHPSTEVATRVSQVLTDALSSVPGSTAIRGSSMSGLAYVDVIFGSSTGLKAHRQEIIQRRRLAAAGCRRTFGCRWAPPRRVPVGSFSMRW